MMMLLDWKANSLKVSEVFLQFYAKIKITNIFAGAPHHAVIL